MLCQICVNSGLSECYASNNGAACNMTCEIDLCDDLYDESFGEYLENLNGSCDSL
jgi:hypothetical protein